MQLQEKSIPATIHRIGAKRVVIEVPETTKSKLRRDRKIARICRMRKVRWIFLLALVASAILLAFVTNSRSLFSAVEVEPAQLEIADSCGDFNFKKDVAVQDTRFQGPGFQDFSLGSWKVRTYGARLNVGAISSMQFEAICGNQVILGRIELAQNDRGYEILKMTPI